MRKSRILLASVASALLMAGASAGLANANTVAGTEYTNAKANPVAGYEVQASPGTPVTYINTYLGDGFSNALANLPAGTSNGFGAEVCNSSTGNAIQVGVTYNGNDTMNVDFATGSLGKDEGGTPLLAAQSNRDHCQNGVLGNFDLTGPTHGNLLTSDGGTPAVPSQAGPPPVAGKPAVLMSGIPTSDTVDVQLAYDNDGSGVNYKHARGHKGQWLVTAQIVPYAASSGHDQSTAGYGYTMETAWVSHLAGNYNEAGFGTEANFAQALTPLSASQTYIGSMAHMRVEYSERGAAYTLGTLPGGSDLLSVDSTSNGDSPAAGGTTYIAPDAIVRDGFGIYEGGLVS